mgnify:CR=1 FL=1
MKPTASSGGGRDPLRLAATVIAVGALMNLLARGLAEYSADECERLKGRRTDEHQEILEVGNFFRLPAYSGNGTTFSFCGFLALITKHTHNIILLLFLIDIYCVNM